MNCATAVAVMSSLDCSKPRHIRVNADIKKLMESNHEVTILRELDEFYVKFHGPSNTLYEGGVWQVRVVLHKEYPLKPPYIEFKNPVFHPNIGENGGVCMDVITEAWTSTFSLANIFELFLPQLLTFPNPVDPINIDAAVMFLFRHAEYKKRVLDFVKKYATEEAARQFEEKKQDRAQSQSGNTNNNDMNSPPTPRV